jgi:hypothetical protein
MGNNNARKHGLYSDRILPEDRGTYEQALTVTGLDEEIALLRVVISRNVDDPDVVCKAIAMLVKAIATEHRLSAEHEQSLYDSIVNTLKGFADAIAE